MASSTKKKRSREIPNVNTNLVEIYEDLANENGDIRLKAAMRLLSTKFEADDLNKILNRLFRGLCSGRKAARLGFSVALTEFLAHYAGSTGQFDPKTILQVYQHQTDPAPSASGQELRDYHFGRLFAAEAIVKSKVFHNVHASRVWPDFINVILDLYQKKSWLREESGWVLYQALQGFQGQPDLFDSAAVIFQQLETRKLLKSLESIALWTLCNVGTFRGLKLPSNVFRNDNPLDVKEQPNLLAALRGTSTITDDIELQGKPNSSTTWSNKTHFAWAVIFEASKKVSSDGTPISNTPHSDDRLFKVLWQEFVDGYLFASSASEQRKYWGFLMVQQFLRDKETADHLFGLNFLRCFANQLCKSDRHLHGIALKTMRAIHGVADGDNEGIFAGKFLIKTVAICHNVDFDKASKTKFVEKLLVKASPSFLLATVDTLSKTMSAVPATIDRSTAQWQIACSDFLLASVKTYQTSKETDQRAESHKTMKLIIRVLTSYGFCNNVLDGKIVTKHQLDIDQHTRDIFRARLLSALSHLITQAEDSSEFAGLAADFLLGMEREHQTQPISESSDAILKIVTRAGKTMRKCSKKALSRSQPSEPAHYTRVYKMFRLLLALSIIQAFSGDADAVNVLEELETASQSILNGHEGKGDHLVSVVEIILSMLAKPSVLFRRVGKEVFSSCAGMLELDGLEPLFDVLEKKENLSGQQELFDTNEDELDEENSEPSESDVEEVNGHDHSDSDITSIEGDGDDQEILEFETKLAQALGTRKETTDPANTQELEDSDDEMMDDDQMAALDPLMSNMFKQHKQISNKKEHKNAKETIVIFKTKVLELLEIFVRQLDQGSDPQSSTIVLLKCLDCIRTTQSKQVSEKAASVVKTALNIYKLSPEVKADKSTLRQAKSSLHTIHEMLRMQGSNAYLRACSQASLFCAKVILNSGGTIEKVWKEYSKTGEVMATVMDCKIVNVLFQDWFNWLGTAKVALSKRVGGSSKNFDDE